MKKLTVRLDEKTAAWARSRAAEHDMSLSRFIGELLEGTMRGSHEYRTAMHAFLSRPPTDLNKDGAPYPSRDELHDRDDLR